MFSSLRAKLVLSHFVVILMAFILTAVIASVPIRRTQEARLRSSLELSSESVARQLDLSRTLGPASPLGESANQLEFAQRLVDNEQRRSGNRVLILNADGGVIMDSDPSGSMLDQSVPTLTAAVERLQSQIGTSPAPRRPVARIALVLETHSVPAGELDDRNTVVSATAATSLPEWTNLYVVAIAPRGSAPLVDDVVRPLVLASGVALAVSIVLGLVIARSVSGPLRQLTADVGTIKARDLDRRISLDTGGEVGTLVTAFNRMLDRISTTYHSQRELLSNIAHELRTPLTSIQGYAQALRDGVIKEDAARSDALAAIADEADRMTELVEQILQLSRLESGQFPVEFEPSSLDNLLARLGRQFAPIAGVRDVRLTVERGTGLEAVLDEELITRALGNLVANAIRHTGFGGSVDVRASRVSVPGRPAGIRLTVRDTGEGMSDEALERIFDRFYRGEDRSATRSARNFGLGLAIVQEIVNLHGGEISVESAVNQGTTFTIDLPGEPDRTRSTPS